MNHANRIAAVMVSGSLLLSATCAHAQNWPQWRGPNRDAKVTGFVAPKTWPKTLTEKWKVTVGDGVATPALVGDRLYVFTREGSDEVIRCLDAATGKQIWENKYAAQPATGAAGSFPGPRSSPTVADGKVVIFGVRGVLSCLNATDGKVIWRKDTKGNPRFFISSSPIVVNGLCIAQIGGPNSGEIVAYDLKSGDEKWKRSGASPAYSSPVLLTVDGEQVIVAETEQNLVAVNDKDGKLLWETAFAPAGRMTYNAATPIVKGNTVIFSGGGHGTRAVKVEKQDSKLVAKELWSNSDANVQFDTPVLKDGLLFGLSPNNQLFCLSAETGKTLWSAPVGQTAGAGPAAGGGQRGREGPGAPGQPGRRGGRGGMMGGRGGRPGFGSILNAGPVLIALTPNEQLIVFEPSDKEFKQVASYKVASSPTYAYPVISGNHIYIKDQDSVILWTID
jgi:outer membrane protein assembly factor BamB